MLFNSLTTSFTSGYLKQILNQFSKAVLAAKSRRTLHGCIPHAVHELAKLEVRPSCLTEIVHDFCSEVVYPPVRVFVRQGGRRIPADADSIWTDLPFVCLELGFRHLDPREFRMDIWLNHTKHHQELAEIVFRSRKSEAIADLLQAWTTEDILSHYADDMLGICTGHLIKLDNLVPFSPRLRRLVIRFVEIVGYQGFEGAGVGKLIELLDHLHVTAEEMDRPSKWASLLLSVIRSPEGIQHLFDWYWELLVEISGQRLEIGDVDALKIAKSLIDAEDWGKLDCWIEIIPAVSDSAGITEEDLEHLKLLLLRQRPGAAQRLEQWMERRWPKWTGWSMVVRTHEAAQRQDAP